MGVGEPYSANCLLCEELQYSIKVIPCSYRKFFKLMYNNYLPPKINKCYTYIIYFIRILSLGCCHDHIHKSIHLGQQQHRSDYNSRLEMSTLCHHSCDKYVVTHFAV